MKILVKRIDPILPTRVALIIGIVMGLVGVILGLVMKLDSNPEIGPYSIFGFIAACLFSAVVYPLGTYIAVSLLNLLLKNRGLELDVATIEEPKPEA